MCISIVRQASHSDLVFWARIEQFKTTKNKEPRTKNKSEKNKVEMQIICLI